MVEYTHILSYDERIERLESLKRIYINGLVADAMVDGYLSIWIGLLRVVSNIEKNMLLMHTGYEMGFSDILRV